MNIRSTIDYRLLQLQYEVFGLPIEELSDQFGVSTAILQVIIEEKGWKRRELTDNLPVGRTDMTPAQIMDQVDDRITQLNTLKKATLNPGYIALETAILGKVLDAVSALNAEHPTSLALLKTAALVFNELRNAGGTAASPDGSDGRGKPVNVFIHTKSANIMAKAG